MDEILKAAQNLGDLIAESDRFVALRRAEKVVEDDPDTKELLKKADAQSEKIAELERSLKPVEPADKEEMQRLTDAMHGNEKLGALARAQADYLELMNKVNDAIRGRLER